MRRSSLLIYDDSEPEDRSINLTPLIDVVFVVLIMFILIAPLVQFDQIQLASGGKESLLPMQNNNAINIRVYADNSIQINGKRIDLPALPAQLRRVREQSPQKIAVQLFHDKIAHFGTYQCIKNHVEAAGFETMDVILEPN